VHVHRQVQTYILAIEEVLRQVIARLDKYEQELREAKRQATPFRRKKKKAKSKHKKPGRKGGHSAEHRAAVDHVDEVCHADLADSPCCHADVEEQYTYEQIQEDIEVRRVVRKIVVHVGQCTCCGERVEGHHPWKSSSAQGAAAHHIGPTALALTTVLHYEQGVPYERIATLLGSLGLADVSKATLVRAMERVGNRAEKTFNELLAKVLEQDVLHIDETGWSIHGTPHYLWVITGGGYTVYFVRKTRSSDEVADFLKDFDGVLVTDGAPAYDKLGKKILRALCLLHLRRNMTTLEEKTTGRGKALARTLKRWLSEAIDFVGQRDTMADGDRRRRAAELETQFIDIIDTSPSNPTNARMIDRLNEWFDAVVLCLFDPAVPATNNHAERQIRPAVVLRKRGGCNRSEQGARTFERLGSLAATARQQRVNFLQWVSDLLCQPDHAAAAAFW
jgi:transposase